jgi:predicted O-methyltransferase YrrM
MVLASVMSALRPGSSVAAIDPHQGRISRAGKPDENREPTYHALLANLAQAGLSDAVHVIRSRSTSVTWSEPIGLLFLDVVHDYDNVNADFQHFRRHLAVGGYVIFDDYTSSFPGVQRVVHEALADGTYREVSRTDGMITIQKTT